MTFEHHLVGYVHPSLADAAEWRQFLDAAIPVGIYTPDGLLLLASRRMLNLFGFPLERLVGHGWMSALYPDETRRSAVLKMNEQVVSSHVPARVLREVTCADGTMLSLELTATAVHQRDGTPVILSVVNAIAAGLHVTPSMPSVDGPRGYRELVEGAPDLLLRAEAESGHLVFVNQFIESITGYPPAAFYADPALWASLLGAKQYAHWRQTLSHMKAGGQRFFDLTFGEGDQQFTIEQQLWGVQSTLRVDDGGGTVHFVEGCGRDVTGVRRLGELTARKAEWRTAEHLKSELVANVSHELRTPLVSIKGYIELLTAGALGPLTDAQSRGLEIAQVNAQRLSQLIESLLDFSRAETGRLSVNRALVDLRQPIVDAAEAMRTLAWTNAPRFDLALPDEPLWVLGDLGRLAQIFRALFTNALKFARPDATEAVEVAARAERDLVEVTVRDHGIGIPSEAQGKVFDRFYQVDASATRRFGGVGLGLALVKELTALHGGTIAVASREGAGSTFTIRLPRASPAATVPGVAAERPVVLVGVADSQRPLYAELLRDAGLLPLDVLWATDVHDLARRARRYHPDLVLLDLPDPAPVFELKRELPTRDLPLVVVSDGGQPVDGADVVVPAGQPARLIGSLRRLLGRGARPLHGRAPRVVIIEDEVEVLDFARFILEREGYDVVGISSGPWPWDESWRRVTADANLLVLDVALQGTDGLDICRHLKADPTRCHVPVLVMTAMAGEEVKRSALAAGAEGYLCKPFSADEFVRAVQFHVDTEHTPIPTTVEVPSEAELHGDFAGEIASDFDRREAPTPVSGPGAAKGARGKPAQKPLTSKGVGG